MMKSYSIILFTSVILLLLTFSCSKENTSVDTAADTYTKKLTEKLPRLNSKFIRISVPSSILQPRRIKALEKNLFVVVDDADKSIVLVNQQGDILDKKGREGRGPGEFQNIAQLHVGQDGRIYLLDMLSFRISIFEVVNDSLEYIEALSYKNPSNHSLHRIYVTAYGNYGVYNQTEGFQTPDNKFLLYRLDENFNPVEQTLEMPGQERQKIGNSDQTLYTPSIYLRKTLWDVDGEWFYFISSHKATINKYNFRTGKREEVSYSQFEERSNSPSYISFMKEHFDSIEDEEQWLPLEESKTLPLFSGFWVQNNKIILRMFYPADEQGMMIHIDQNAEEITYFHTPYEYDQPLLRNGKLYGIDPS